MSETSMKMLAGGRYTFCDASVEAGGRIRAGSDGGTGRAFANWRVKGRCGDFDGGDEEILALPVRIGGGSFCFDSVEVDLVHPGNGFCLMGSMRTDPSACCPLFICSFRACLLARFAIRLLACFAFSTVSASLFAFSPASFTLFASAFFNMLDFCLATIRPLCNSSISSSLVRCR